MEVFDEVLEAVMREAARRVCRFEFSWSDAAELRAERALPRMGRRR
jgi:hypothetical protein